MAGVSAWPPTTMSSKYVRSAATALHHQLGLALLHDLVALVDDRARDGDDAAVGLRRLRLSDDLRAQPDGVADLDRVLELPAEADERECGEGLSGPGEQTGLNGEPEQAVGDPLAEERRLHELGVGVEHVVVAGEPGEEDDVGLGDRTPWRLVLLADLDVVEVPLRHRHVRRRIARAGSPSRCPGI